MSWLVEVVRKVWGLNPSPGVNVYIPCPLSGWRHPKGSDSSPSFSLTEARPHHGVGFCWSCKWTGNLHQLRRELDENFDPAAGRLAEVLAGDTTLGDIAVYWQQQKQEETGPMAEMELDYPLIKEGQCTWLPYSVQQLADVRWDPKWRGPSFPVYTYEGKLVGAQVRPLNPPKGKKWVIDPKFSSGRVLYGEWLSTDLTEVVLVEGPKDALMLKSFFPDRSVEAMFGSELSVTQAKRVAARFDRVILFMDNDSAGEKGVRKCVAALHKQGLDNILVVSYLGLAVEDPGVCTRELAGKLITRARPVRFVS